MVRVVTVSGRNRKLPPSEANGMERLRSVKVLRMEPHLRFAFAVRAALNSTRTDRNRK
jgi:hypothetical protein